MGDFGNNNIVTIFILRLTMQNQKREITTEKAMEKVQGGALFVDVREEDEIRQLAFDVPEIMHIPLSKFVKRFAEIPKDRDVVVVCNGGGRSLTATDFLLSQGFTTVSNLSGGIIQWADNNFPLT